MKSAKQNKNEVDEYIREQDPEKIKAVHKKGVKFFINLYNKLCRECKEMCVRNPKSEFNAYCDKCKITMEDLWNKK